MSQAVGRNSARRRTEDGVALVVVVLLTLGVTAVLVAMLVGSNTEHQVAANERDSERALQASKAGLNYAYSLYANGLIAPSTSGTAFNSFSTSVAASLDGAAFAGRFFNASSGGTGQTYRIVSTGTYNRGSRTTELVFQLVPYSLTYGYLAFDNVTLHHHASGATPFDIRSTIFSNNTVSIDDGMNINGSVVGSGSVSIPSSSSVQGDVFSYSVSNSGTIAGKVGLVASVNPTSGAPAVTDNTGTKYVWYSGRSNPGTKAGGTILGGVTRYVVQNGDVFDSNIFTSDGSLILNPPLNVIKYIAPPQIDYAAMKQEADLNDPTYFTSPAAAAQYLASKKVTETVGGQTLVTMKVGTPSAPEFLYVSGALHLELDPAAKADDYGSGLLKADGLHLEGGIFASGGFSFNGKGFTNPASYPAGYDQLRIRAIPHCFPAVVSYQEPSSGTIDTWSPADTPVMSGGGSNIDVKSSNGDYEGTVLLHGLVYGQGQVHIHHTQSNKELVTFRGAELAWKIHNCDFFNFQYDPAVSCTKFLGMNGNGAPQVVSYREIRQ